ncbi:unnamed protein product [Trichogramma brassicae]|uniref:Gamma-aminobutyric acid receptor subunit beta n=1 Tax=Trichogramma brassicae TaxID=86971 RepID=A0A6H5HZW8_9HYME|nr:unnamed protein product [Trichogramma brassicae]
MRRLGVQGLIFFYLVNLRSCATPSLDCRIPFFRAGLLRDHTLLASPPELSIRTRCLVPSGEFCGSRFCRRWQVPQLLVGYILPFTDSLRARIYCSCCHPNPTTRNLCTNCFQNMARTKAAMLSGPPVEVGVTMYVLSISSLSEVKMDFTLDFYFRQFWTDPRLSFKKRPGVEILKVGSEFIKNIWVPDTFFVNEKQSYFHVATTSNEFIRIHHSGSITRSIRLTITASCPMNLQYFPMDRQLCNIEIESFGYTMRDIRYKWNEGLSSVGVSNDVSLPQFKVLGHRQRAMEISLTTVRVSRRMSVKPYANCRVSCKWPRVVQEVRFTVRDHKAHSKGGTLENTINGRADEEAPPPPQHHIHPSKDISKLYGRQGKEITEIVVYISVYDKRDHEIKQIIDNQNAFIKLLRKLVIKNLCDRLKIEILNQASFKNTRLLDHQTDALPLNKKRIDTRENKVGQTRNDVDDDDDDDVASGVERQRQRRRRRRRGSREQFGAAAAVLYTKLGEAQALSRANAQRSSSSSRAEQSSSSSAE